MSPRPFRVALALSVVSLVVASPRSGFAQAAGDEAAAEALFNEGKRLVSAGQIGTACPKFAESLRLDPGLGTMLWLADCYEKNGQTASAWAQFKDAEALGTKQRDPRTQVARDSARKLEPKLSKLVIEVAPSVEVPGLEVRRDGVVIGKPSWGTPLPTDPGEHRVSATAPGRLPWNDKVSVGASGATASMKVPALAAAPVAPTSPSPATADTTEPPPIAGAGTTGNGQRIAGLVTGGVGIVALGIGGYFGLSAKSKVDDAAAHCTGNVCDDTGFDLRRSAITSATISTIAFVAGALALAGGVVLYLTAPRGAVQAGVTLGPAVGLREAGGVLRAAW